MSEASVVKQSARSLRSCSRKSRRRPAKRSEWLDLGKDQFLTEDTRLIASRLLENQRINRLRGRHNPSMRDSPLVLDQRQCLLGAQSHQILGDNTSYDVAPFPHDVYMYEVDCTQDRTILGDVEMLQGINVDCRSAMRRLLNTQVKLTVSPVSIYLSLVFGVRSRKLTPR